MKGIDPKWAMYLGLLVTIEQAIGHGTVSLTNLVPAAWAPYITSWCNFLAFVGTAIMTYQAATSSAAAGPLVGPVPPVVKVLVAAVALSMLLGPGGAHAQGLKFPKPRPIAAAATPVDPLQKFMTDIENIKADIVTGVIADLTAADADAATLTTTSDPTSFRDPIAHACYPAAIKFLQSLPTATAPSGKYVLIQLFQKKRDFVAQIQAGLPLYLKMGCAPLLGDEVTIFTKMMGMVGVTVSAGAITGLFPAAAPLTLPALTL